jgi:hypothetical protein
MISQSDRIAFSRAIVNANDTINGINTAQQAQQDPLSKAQALDLANKNLFDPINTLITGYHAEISLIDGNQRTSIIEQDILDSANRKMTNHFYPNNTSISVPSLSATNNVWTQTKPFALTYCIGKNYSETHSTISPNENSLIATIQSYTNLTPPLTVTGTVNTYITLLNTEVSSIVTNDPNSTAQTQNNAAISNINIVILPALNAYLLGGTLTALQTAVTNRATFLTTRMSQINTVLGSISQDISTGKTISSSGYYGTRYSYLLLRLDLFSGSTIQVANILNTINVQDGIKNSITAQANSYMAILPTTTLKANGNATNIISVINPSIFNSGDVVYIYAENQEELLRSIRSISGDSLTLNDVIPAKYRTTDKLRIYKDIS